LPLNLTYRLSYKFNVPLRVYFGFRKNTCLGRVSGKTLVTHAYSIIFECPFSENTSKPNIGLMFLLAFTNIRRFVLSSQYTTSQYEIPRGQGDLHWIWQSRSWCSYPPFIRIPFLYCIPGGHCGYWYCDPHQLLVVFGYKH
jgi:hypothetical protein